MVSGTKFGHFHSQLLRLVLVSIAVPSSIVGSNAGLLQHFETSPSKNLTVPKDTSITIPCLVRNRQGECLWIKDGRGLGVIANKYEFQRSPPNGDCSITIHDLDLKVDDGLWQCQVTAPTITESSLVSSVIKLTVLVAPSKPAIVRTPPYAPKLQVYANRSNGIECQAVDSNPPAVINWFLNKENITDLAVSNVIQKPNLYTTTSQLNASFDRYHNNATLTCFAFHPLINQTDAVILNVLYKPIVTVRHDHYSLMEGSDLRIDCSVDANPMTSIIWQRLGNTGTFPIPSSSHHDASILNLEKIGRELNGAIFQCSAQNQYGMSVPARVKVDVLYTPRVLNTSSAQSVMTGSPARLHCVYDGNPTPEIRWYHINPRTGITTRVITHSDQQHVLSLNNVTYNDEGEYFCEAINEINQLDYIVRSSNMMLDVYGLPAFLTKSPIITEGKRGGESHLSLWFCSDPQPVRVFWQFGSIKLEVTHLDDYNKNNVKANNVNSSLHSRFIVNPLMPLPGALSYQRKREPSSNCYDSTLLIKDTDISDQRDYVLIVENERGFQEGIVKLKVVNPMSATLLIATALSIIAVVFGISVITLLFVRRKRKGKENVSEEEGKEDAQVLAEAIKDSPETRKEKPPQTNDRMENGENKELVYANLSFPKENKPPPQTRPKPPIHQRSRPNNNHSSTTGSTEYAKLAFTTKADL